MPKLPSINLELHTHLTGNHVTVSNDILKQVNLKPGHQIKLRFGNRNTSAVITSFRHTTPPATVYLSKHVKDSLLLPVPVKLNLLLDSESGDWRLGPIIAIFANRTENPAKPFGEQTRYFTKLRAVATRLNSFCFAFCPREIDWDAGVIKGAIPPLPGEKQWQNFVLPFPDVIYDRGLFPRGEKRRLATEARKILRNYPGLKFFNPAFFGKWKTHKLLSKHEVLQEHLPETRLFTSDKDLRELLKKHSTLYLKPSGGSSGRGIIRLSTAAGGYSLNFRQEKQVNSLFFTDLGRMIKWVTRIIGQNRYIVQQGLSLARLHGCPLDIRVLMQRNHSGIWLRTGMAVRVAGEGNYISNIHAGGHAVKISQVLPLIFPDLLQVEKIRQEITRLTSLIAAWVTSEGNPLFGEIAVDLGVDEDGRVWIIELNAIPGRSVFRHIGAQNIQIRAISRPIEYAYYLSGFAPQSGK